LIFKKNNMKKVAVLAAFIVFGFISVNAQNSKSSASPVAPATAVVEDVTADKPAAKEDKKATDKHCSDKKENKGCGDAKASGKKSCCSAKKAEAKKEEN